MTKAVATLLNIGEFSRMTHLSVKALRHYADLGVLAPHRDLLARLPDRRVGAL